MVFAGFVYGVVVFIWLSLEDKSVVSVSVLGTGLSLLLTLRLARQIGIYPPRPRSGRGARGEGIILLLLGMLCGAGATSATDLLMLIKTSLHSHIYPDYPLPLMTAMLTRLPAWSIAGALIGVAINLLRRNYGSSTSSYSRSSSSSSSSSALVEGFEDDAGALN
jgi:hypothetical protein